MDREGQTRVYTSEKDVRGLREEVRANATTLPNYAHTFEYPVDRLLKLKGTIPEEEMRHPPALD